MLHFIPIFQCRARLHEALNLDSWQYKNKGFDEASGYLPPGYLPHRGRDSWCLYSAHPQASVIWGSMNLSNASQEPIFPPGSRRPASALREDKRPCVKACFVWGVVEDSKRKLPCMWGKPLPSAGALVSRVICHFPSRLCPGWTLRFPELPISYLLNKGDNHQIYGLSWFINSLKAFSIVPGT